MSCIYNFIMSQKFGGNTSSSRREEYPVPQFQKSDVDFTQPDLGAGAYLQKVSANNSAREAARNQQAEEEIVQLRGRIQKLKTEQPGQSFTDVPPGPPNEHRYLKIARELGALVPRKKEEE